MTHNLQTVIDALNWTTVNVPWAGIAASGALSAVLEAPKKLVQSWFVHDKVVMVSLVGIGGILIAGSHYLLANPDYGWSLVFLQGLAIAFGTQPFYRVLVKPASVAVGAWLLQQAQKAVEYNDLKSAAVPAAGIKISYGATSPATVPSDEF